MIILSKHSLTGIKANASDTQMAVKMAKMISVFI
jgi:hypothetical protein